MCSKRNAVLLSAAAAALYAAPALAQLRVVTLNGYNSDPLNSYWPNPRSPWIDKVLGAIGSSVSDDPFIAGNTGIVKPIDVLALQEVESAETTVKGYCNIMNTLYPGANYQYGKIDGATTG